MEAIILALIPLLLAIIALAVVWGQVLTKLKVMRDDMDHTEKRMDESDKTREKLKLQYMSKSEHELICANTTLTLKAHITESLDSLKEAIFEKMDVIEKAINSE